MTKANNNHEAKGEGRSNLHGPFKCQDCGARRASAARARPTSPLASSSESLTSAFVRASSSLALPPRRVDRRIAEQV
eukprot:30898-Pelagococcus_subviridis.AAC.8